MASWRAIRWLVLIGAVVGLPGHVLAQARSGVGVVTTVVGEVTVARAAAAQPERLRMRDHVLALDRISTKERAVVHVLMSGRALLTVRELSVVTVSEEGGRARIDLQSGKVGLAVVRERMKPGELIEIQTPHAVAAVRGTVLVIEVVPGPPGEAERDNSAGSTDIHLLHGKLDVSLRSDPGLAPVRLESLQTVTVSRNALGMVRLLDPAAATAVTAGLKPDREPIVAIPDGLHAMVGERHAALALETAAALSGNGQRRESMKGRSAKIEATALAKASDGGSNRDVIIPVSDVGEGAAFGSSFGPVGDVSGGLVNGGGNGLVGNGGLGSISGGGMGAGLGSGGNRVGAVVMPVQPLPLLNRKRP